MSPNVGPFSVSQNSPSILTIDEDGKLNSVPMDCITLAPTPNTVQDVLNDANNDNKDELLPGAMRDNAHQKQVVDDIVDTTNRDSDEHNVDNDNA